MKNKIVILPLVILLTTNFSYGEELPVTLSTDLDDVVFDGI